MAIAIFWGDFGHFRKANLFKIEQMSLNLDREVILVNNLLDRTGIQSSLTDVQELVLRHCCLGHSYQEIADNSNYQYGYVKKVGSQLWRLLSECLGKKISKSNVRSLLHYQIQTMTNQEMNSLA